DIDVHDARVDRRGHPALVSPAENLAEPAHLQSFEGITGKQGPERRYPANDEQERPGRSEPDLFAGGGGPGRTAPRHFLSVASLERITTPGRSGAKFAARANCRHGNAAPRNTPPTSGSPAGPRFQFPLSA